MVKEETQVWQRKYALVKRDNVSRGVQIISFHWLKWLAAWRADYLTRGYARAHAIRSAWFVCPDAPRFTWEVRERCH